MLIEKCNVADLINLKCEESFNVVGCNAPPMVIYLNRMVRACEEDLKCGAQPGFFFIQFR